MRFKEVVGTLAFVVAFFVGLGLLWPDGAATLSSLRIEGAGLIYEGQTWDQALPVLNVGRRERFDLGRTYATETRTFSTMKVH
jgi:hypothetical protein